VECSTRHSGVVRTTPDTPAGDVRKTKPEEVTDLRRCHVPHSRPMSGRYVYINGQGVSNERVAVELFGVALCEPMILL